MSLTAPPDLTLHQRIKQRRLVGFVFIGLLLCVDLYATGLLGGSERALAVSRTLVLPGIAFLEWHIGVGIAAIVCALTAIGAWLRWGMDWVIPIIVLVSVLIALFIMPLHHQAPDHHTVVQASHEFTIVLVVFALLARLRLLIGRLPGTDWLKTHLPQGWFFPAADMARAAALTLIVDPGSTVARSLLKDPQQLFARRARRINIAARLRIKGHPLDGAHAPLRAARALAGLQDAAEAKNWITLMHTTSLAGVPC